MKLDIFDVMALGQDELVLLKEIFDAYTKDQLEEVISHREVKTTEDLFKWFVSYHSAMSFLKEQNED